MHITGNVLLIASALWLTPICRGDSSPSKTLPSDHALDVIRAGNISRIDGEFDANNKETLEPAAIDSEVALLKAVYDAKPDANSPKEMAVRDEMLRKYRDGLLNGSKAHFAFTLYMGQNSVLVHFKPQQQEIDSGAALDTWELQEGSINIQIFPNERRGEIYKRDLGLSSDLAVLLHAMDFLGQDKPPTTLLLKQISNSDKSRVLASEFATYVLQRSTDMNGFLQEKTIESKKIVQKEDFKFGNFSDNEGLKIPTSIIYQIKTSTLQKDVQITISSVKRDLTTSTEVGLPTFGCMRMEDHRFEPALHYEALGQLPSDELVSKFVDDPQFLDQYNQQIDRRSEGP